MSLEVADNDLINLHDGSPILTARSLPLETHLENEDTGNLIDSELPVLEKTLKTAQNIPISDSRRTSVDIEDILITIDDEVQSTNGDVVDGESNANEGERCDNLEALIILQNLDDILNACLSDCNENETDVDDVITNNLNDSTQETIEDCLKDLDNYLKALDSSGCDDFSENNIDDQPSTSTTSSFTESGESFDTTSEDTIDEESLRNKLRQMEENYTRFVAAASGCVNRGYVDTEGIEEGNNGMERRPLSACDVPSGALNRNHPHRATVAVVRRERPTLTRTPFRKSIDNSSSSRCVMILLG